MGCSFGWGHWHGQGWGGGVWFVVVAGFALGPGIARLLCVLFCCERTPMQAGPGAFLPSNSNEAVYCLCVCVRSCSSSSSSKTHTHKTPCTHPLSRQDLLVGLFFVSHAIPLLASEASLFIYPYITIALRGCCPFSLVSFLRDRPAYDWPCPEVWEFWLGWLPTVHGIYRRNGVVLGRLGCIHVCMG